ncbi:MAG TPA: gamma-glutamyltransferase [Edaphobacter sp.]|nr:gamma-glutamyltransferase [Edaphobacter sp.]
MVKDVVGIGQWCFAAALCVSALSPVLAQDRSQNRSVVMTTSGIVASENPLASQAGAQILACGGNAIDAAVATNAVMGVVEPMMNGMGGDLFAIVYEAKTGKVYGLNASGWAPKGMTIDALKRKGVTEMPNLGINSVTVPGAVDGWAKMLQRFGTKQFAEVLAPAIYYAREGYPVPEWTSAYWHDYVGLLQKNTNASKTFLLDGHEPQPGQIFRNANLAHSLELVAKGGRDAYYKGEISSEIIATEQRLGGTMSSADLAEYSSEWVEPISTTYRGWKVYEIPPNGQGIAALEMLDIMEGFPLGQYGPNSADALHVLIEAKKLAYADLLKFVADPKFATIPVSGMLSKSYAAQRAKQIDMVKANCSVTSGEPSFSPKGDTTYLTVVDKDGNMVSLIQSVYLPFGSGVVADGTGFVLQNRGGLFSFDPTSPNRVEGHKRPLHTIIPGLMINDKQRISFGIMGGFNQAQAQAQFISNVVDHGMNVQAAMDQARFTKLTFAGCDLNIENRVSPEVRSELTKRGHQLKVDGTFSSNVGGGQAIMHDIGTGVNFGGSDARKDGEAIPEPVPMK